MDSEEKVETIVKIVKILFIVLPVFEAMELFSKKNKRRWWVREANLSRDLYGFYEKSFKEIKTNDKEDFFKLTRMSVHKFHLLLELLHGRLEKCSKRPSITPEHRLAVTLMFLAHGCSPQVLAWTHKMGVSTIRKIIYETCDVLWEELHNVYLATPTMFEWKNIANRFFQKTGVPNCIGAIDGKHVNIVCPRLSGSVYYNYKHKYSIVLLAGCDSNYTFTLTDVGAVGSQSDGGIFSRSEFGKQILNGTLALPRPPPLPGTETTFPFFFVADSAFPLRRNIMRPYPGRNLPPAKDCFNARISKARVYIENAFGILANRWRILHRDIYAAPKNVDKIILATVLLHNFLMLQKDDAYFTEDLVDHEVNGETVLGTWRDNGVSLRGQRHRPNRASQQAFELREILKNYFFNSE